ncbi:MAG: putative nucleotide-diphospho-sugar transferase [Planctomycetota bacterium]|nr:putative nucleotide-diphospho-sugar transferase [Planctomycetota bacterium]
MIAATMYTAQGAYADAARILRTSCERWGIELRERVIESAGTWQRTCNLKPAYVLECLRAWGEPVLWLDADTEVMADPVLLREGAGVDFMAINCRNEPRFSRTGVLTPETLDTNGGVLWFAPTDAAISLVEAWHARATAEPDRGNDTHLNAAFNEDRRTDLRFRWVPLSYNRLDSVWPDVRPVINHRYGRGALLRVKSRLRTAREVSR